MLSAFDVQLPLLALRFGPLWTMLSTRTANTHSKHENRRQSRPASCVHIERMHTSAQHACGQKDSQRREEIHGGRLPACKAVARRGLELSVAKSAVRGVSSIDMYNNDVGKESAQNS